MVRRDSTRDSNMALKRQDENRRLCEFPVSTVVRVRNDTYSEPVKMKAFANPITLTSIAMSNFHSLSSERLEYNRQ